MCGRAVQTQGAVMMAASSLGSNAAMCRGGPPRAAAAGACGNINNNNDDRAAAAASSSSSSTADDQWSDNYNLSPSHDAVVFTLNQTTGEIDMDRKVWGLITKNGTSNNPVPTGASKHFSNLMFNARSDTLFTKPTFARLLREGKTCIVAFDGFFEWKNDDVRVGKGKKQPYFVFRKEADGRASNSNCQRRPLLLAGLWTRVNTAWDDQPTLDTFTVLTTEICDPLKWLHSRMPVTIWNEELALQWLKDPSQKLLQQLDMAAHKTEEDALQWHAVSPQMSSTKYRSADSIKALPKPRSVLSFFATVKKGDSVPKSTSMVKNSKASSEGKMSKKHPLPSTTEKQAYAKPAPSKKAKTESPPAKKNKGTITSFFAPKSSKA